VIREKLVKTGPAYPNWLIAPQGRPHFVLTLLPAVIISACGGGGGGATSLPPPPPPPLPILAVDAGPNQAVDEGDLVILSGKGSENADSFSWQQTAGPDVQLDLSNTSAPTFTAPSISGETVLTFELTVGNDVGDLRTDSIRIVVIFGNSAPLSRPADPVVLKGKDLPMFNGEAPDSLVAFRYEGGWAQIPVQVDERDVRSYGEIYDFLDHWSLLGSDADGDELYPYLEEFYTDPDTYMGPDTDPMLDDNDEVVFMARDTGSIASAIADPQGVIAGLRAEVRASDPLDGTTGYVYLFQSAGGLDPSAGQSYVDYQYELLSGDYLGTFSLLGVNLELSTASSNFYERTFSSRRRSEVMRITAPGASGVDILDREKRRIESDSELCISDDSEASSEEEEGAFIANKSGPVRGIRSHLGDGSGPATQKVRFFYERREDIVLYWRVHGGGSRNVLELIDYDPAAIGMTYFNNNNLAGVIVDGVPDSVAPGILQWELITGFHGSIVTTRDIVSSGQNWLRCRNRTASNPEGDCELIVPPISSYYLDDASYSERLCPDDFAIGMSGQAVAMQPDTDPRTSSFELAFVSSRYYGAPGWAIADAEQISAFSENPLVPTVPNQ
jgi:hypothetical protein